MADWNRQWTATLFAAAMAMSVAGLARADGDSDGSAGRMLFVQKGCIGCHGREARGGFGPALESTALPFEKVLEQLRHPRGRMPMFSEAIVSDMEARAIYDYVRSLGGVAPDTESAAPAAKRASSPPRAQAKAKAARPPSESAADAPEKSIATVVETSAALPIESAPRETYSPRMRGRRMFRGHGMGCRHHWR